MWKQRVIDRVTPAFHQLVWYGAKLWVEQIRPRLPWTFPSKGWLSVDLRGQGTILHCNPWDLTVSEVVLQPVEEGGFLVAWSDSYVLVADSGSNLCTKIGQVAGTHDPILSRVFLGCKGMDVVANDFALGLINGMCVCGQDYNISVFSPTHTAALKALCELKGVYLGQVEPSIEWME
jgi:hypothetical protein